MSAGFAPDGTLTGIDGLCEQIRGSFAGWAPRLLGVHVPRSVCGPAEVARLVGAVADAAELTGLQLRTPTPVPPGSLLPCAPTSARRACVTVPSVP
ncbi:hypothetical protein ACFQ7Z_03715 [Streptomyces virginiae]|uniref:hypothetical protein n=1 Tax=Streptomyces virginiae TaxID=1961 RepID=UPI0036C9B3A7